MLCTKVNCKLEHSSLVTFSGQHTSFTLGNGNHVKSNAATIFAQDLLRDEPSAAGGLAEIRSERLNLQAHSQMLSA
jgi:hypothetical protein